MPFSLLQGDSLCSEVVCFDEKLQAGKSASTVREFKGVPEIIACEEEEGGSV